MKRVALLSVLTLAAANVLCWPLTVLSHETVTTTVLFDREIVRILDRHCVMCHVEGGPSFPLATYEQVWLQKRKVGAEVLARHMPPWAAMSGYGRFANENIVTLRESQFIVSWMEGLGPRNAGKVFTNTAAQAGATPVAARAHIDLGVWHLGQPDIVRDIPPQIVEPGRPDDVVRTLVDLGTSGERRVRAFEYRPGDRRVVRAAFFSVQETGQWVGSWTPWYGFVKLPANVAYRLPAGAHIAAEIHYRHTNERVVDRGRIGLFVDTGTAAKPVSDLVLAVRRESVAPTGAKSVRFRADTVLTVDTTLLALRPDLPPGVTSIEVAARRPDGGTNVLLFAKDIPDAWPTPYIFRDPVTLPRGTTLSVTAYMNAAPSPGPESVRLIVSSYRRNG
jgi:hypothetical protein